MTEAEGQILRDMVATESMLSRFGAQARDGLRAPVPRVPASSYPTGTSLLVGGGVAAL